MSTSEITLPPTVVDPAPRRRRTPMVLLAIGIVLVALFIVAAIVTVPYDELVPGQAQSVSKLITVPRDRAHPLHGQVFLTDVGLVENLHLLALIPAWFDNDATLVKTDELTGNLPEAEFNDQGTVDMAESQLTAKSVALRQLGYSIPERDVGATVYGIEPGTPGYRALQVGDVITAVDGVATPNPDGSDRRHPQSPAGPDHHPAGRFHRPSDPGSDRLAAPGPGRRSRQGGPLHRDRGHGDPARLRLPLSHHDQLRRDRRSLGRVWPGRSASSTPCPGVV